MEKAIATIKSEKDKFVKAIAGIEGVRVTPRGVDVTYACDGIDFRLEITINGNQIEACGSFYDGAWVYFVCVPVENGEYGNVYVPDGEGIDSLVALVKKYGTN